MSFDISQALGILPQKYLRRESLVVVTNCALFDFFELSLMCHGKLS
jgi:hypothetical protein